MLKIDKRVNIPVYMGSVTERMANYLDDSEKKGMVSCVERLRRWSVVGFQLQELGGGIVEAWLSMERDGELNDKSKAEKAEILIHMLERVSGSGVKPKKKAVVVADPPAKIPISKLANSTA